MLFLKRPSFINDIFRKLGFSKYISKKKCAQFLATQLIIFCTKVWQFHLQTTRKSCGQPEMSGWIQATMQQNIIGIIWLLVQKRHYKDLKSLKDLVQLSTSGGSARCIASATILEVLFFSWNYSVTRMWIINLLPLSNHIRELSHMMSDIFGAFLTYLS